MKPIICKNNGKEIIREISNYLKENNIVDLMVVDESNDEIVILISSNEEIDKKTAEIWWEGYQAGMGIL